MTRNAHRRHWLNRVKAAAKLAFILLASVTVCGFVIYTFLTIITCPP
jgi:hypothetical protein